MPELEVSEAFDITGRGAAILFESQPDPVWDWCEHEVRVDPPSGDSFKTFAQVEFALHSEPKRHETMGLLFPNHRAIEFPSGTRITYIRAIPKIGPHDA